MADTLRSGHGPGHPASGRWHDGTDRQTEIDGLRGWAALAVLLFHFLYETFGARFPDLRNPVSGSVNGAFAVFVFFVLSGDALSTSFLAGRGAVSVVALAVRRHSRLALPILASVALVYILQQLNVVFSVQAGPIVGRADWLGTFGAGTIGAREVVDYAAIGVFTTQDPTRHVIPFLWTMCAELTGSVFVFAILLCWHKLRHRYFYLPPLVAILLTVQPTAFLGCFLAGLLFCDARQRGLVAAVRDRRWAGCASTVAMLAMLVWMSTCPPVTGRRPAVAAILFVGAAYVNRHAVAFFRNAVSRQLGRLSFPLYLVHFSVLISLTSFLIVRCDAAGALTEAAAIAIGMVSVAASLLLAWAFTPVEVLTKKAGRMLTSIVLAPISRQWVMTSA